MTTWLLLADRSSARILDHDGYLEEVERIACTDPCPPDSEVVSVAPRAASGGRSDGSSSEWAVVRRQTAASRFALRLAAHLERARQRSSFERLVLVAEPSFLELLRMWLSKSVLELVVASFATDSEIAPELVPTAEALSASAA